MSKNRRKQELKRKKVRKEKRARKTQRTETDGDEYAHGGGVMQSMVRGMKSAVGVRDDKDKKKPSLLSNIVWLLILGAAAGYLVYNYTR